MCPFIVSLGIAALYTLHHPEHPVTAVELRKTRTVTIYAGSVVAKSQVM
jgi:hypothetical protein